MKKILTLMVALLFVAGAASARDRVSRNVADLPAQAQATLQQHFRGVAVNHIKIDKGSFGKVDYEVVLNNGTEIDFNKDGSLKEVNCGTRSVPAALIPASIRDYVSGNYSGQNIVTFEINRNNYEVQLANGTELKFDRAGNFLKVDY